MVRPFRTGLGQRGTFLLPSYFFRSDASTQDSNVIACDRPLHASRVMCGHFCLWDWLPWLLMPKAMTMTLFLLRVLGLTYRLQQGLLCSITWGSKFLPACTAIYLKYTESCAEQNLSAMQSECLESEVLVECLVIGFSAAAEGGGL